MLKKLIYALYLITAVIRTLLWPLWPVLALFWPWAKERWEFEALEHKRQRPLEVDWTLEVASEGELEQLMPFIRQAWGKKLVVDLYYASASVHKKAKKLEEEKLVARALPLPLLRFSLCPTLFGRHLFYESKAQNLLMCRYDFYPELLAWGYKHRRPSFLFWASVKNKKWSFSLWPYRLFEKIVTANKGEMKLLCDFGLDEKRLMAHDFRPGRILQRQSLGHKVLAQYSFWPAYLKELESRPLAKRWIMGSAYLEDLEFLSDPMVVKAIASGEIHLAVASHKLDAQTLERFCYRLQERLPQVPVVVLKSTSDQSALPSSPFVALMAFAGALCELYSYYGIAYVGGGYNYSVHSLLEPAMSGALVYCGPKNHRSTEKDLILEVAKDSLRCLWDNQNWASLALEQSQQKNRPDWEHQRQKWQMAFSQLAQEDKTVMNWIWQNSGSENC